MSFIFTILFANLLMDILPSPLPTFLNKMHLGQMC